VIHLYAFVQGVRELETGLHPRPFGSVAAVVGPEESDPLRHGLVVEGLLDRADAVLPVRFGERFVDDAELAAAVMPRLEALERQLGHVAGCVEVGVRIVPRPRPAQGQDGAGYMRARLLEQVAADELHRKLATRARDSVRTSHDAGYLVARADVGGFSRAVEQLLESNPAVDVLCTGPWAPYSFAAAT
jgi:gas vesicle protein GvpL/GvpF